MEDVIKNLSRRYAVKAYDSSVRITDSQLDTLLEAGRLSPSSYGLQPYKIIAVTDPVLREKLMEASYGQRPVADSSVLLVLARYSGFPEGFVDDYVRNISQTRGIEEEKLAGMRKTIENTISNLTPEGRDAWNKNQTYILLGTLLSAAAAMGLDATPMEGFEPEKYDELLGLKDKGLKSTVIMAVGRHSDADRYFGLKKVRRPMEISNGYR